MKKYLKILVLLLISIFLIGSIAYNSSSYLLDKTWKYYSGFSSGDIIEFEMVNNEKLKIKGIDSAEVVYCFNNYLVVKNTVNNQYGYYILKSGFK